MDPMGGLYCWTCRKGLVEAEILSCRHRFCPRCFVAMFDPESGTLRCDRCLQALNCSRPWQADFLPTPTSVPGSVSPSEIDYNGKVAPEKTFSGENLRNGDFYPRFLAVHEPSGDMYMTDWEIHTVHVLSGNAIDQIVQPGQFRHPAGVAVTDRRELIVADRSNHRIQILSQDGTLIRQFGKEGSGDVEFIWTAGVAYSRNKIYVCDYKRVKVFGMEGDFISSITHPEIKQLWGIAVRDDGVIAVSDILGHCVFRFSLDGYFIGRFGSHGSGPGQMKSPAGLAMDWQRNILLADSDNNRVSVLTPEGSGVIHHMAVDSRPLDVAVHDGIVAVTAYHHPSNGRQLILY